MKLTTTFNFALIAITSLSSNASASSIKARCRTGNSTVLDEFSSATNKLFENLPLIKRCGDLYLGMTNFPSVESYSNCVASLEIPDIYMEKIMGMNQPEVFGSYEKFIDTIKEATSEACKEIKSAHTKERADIAKKDYVVSVVYASNEFESY